MNRPRIKLKLSPIDLAIELVSIICLLFLIGLSLAISLYSQNFTIPINGYGSVWFFAAKGLFVYSGLTILSRFPHVFNYPVEVSLENAGQLYRSATILLRLVKMLLMLFFAFFSLCSSGITNGLLCRIAIIILFIIIIAIVWGAIIRMGKK